MKILPRGIKGVELPVELLGHKPALLDSRVYGVWSQMPIVGRWDATTRGGEAQSESLAIKRAVQGV
jgi:hypothetical protein